MLHKLCLAIVLWTSTSVFALVNLQAGFIPGNTTYKSGFAVLTEYDPLPFVSLGTGLIKRETKTDPVSVAGNSINVDFGSALQIPLYLKLNSPELPFTGLSAHASFGYMYNSTEKSIATSYSADINSNVFFAFGLNYDVAPFIDLGVTAFFNQFDRDVTALQLGQPVGSKSIKQDDTFYMIHLGIDF